MKIIPNAVVEELCAVEPGSLIYVPFGRAVVPAIKGQGEDQAGGLHDVFTLLPIPHQTELPALVTPNETQCVLNFGKEWTLEPPIDSRLIIFGELPVEEGLCGLVIVGATQYLRVYYEGTATGQRPAFLDLSTGESKFRPPEGPQVLLAGWTVRQRRLNLDHGNFEERIIAAWRTEGLENPG